MLHRRTLALLLVTMLVAAALPQAAGAASGAAYSYTGHWPADVPGFSSLAVDKTGRVFAAGPNENMVNVSAPTGHFSFGSFDGTGTDVFDGIRALAIDRWDRLYVADATRIQVFDRDQKLLRSIPVAVSALAVAEDGTVYASREGTVVARWDALFAPLAAWSASSTVAGLAADAEGHLHTAEGDGIQRYAIGGGRLSEIAPAGAEAGRVTSPGDVDVDPFGQLIVADTGNERVQVFDAAGAFKSLLSGPDGMPFAAPRAAAAGRRRELWVADGAPNEQLHRLDTTAPTTYSEISGVHRYKTSAQASKRAYPDEAAAVVLATGENFPDALGGAALAGALHAPLMLTRKLSCPT